jgi:acetolactate synthase-1/3 small subunit
MEKRWISLYVENEIGVLAKIAGLFSSKAYNLDSLTVGETQDCTISRMTIGLTSDDMTFEQIKKQLNRCVGIIKVLDFTDIPIYMKEILFVKINHCTKEDKQEAFRIATVFDLKVSDYNRDHILLECVKSKESNDDMIQLIDRTFSGKTEIVRGGSVAIEAISITKN